MCNQEYLTQIHDRDEVEEDEFFTGNSFITIFKLERVNISVENVVILFLDYIEAVCVLQNLESPPPDHALGSIAPQRF